MKRWVYREYDQEAARRLQAEAGLTPLMSKLLAQRGMSCPEEVSRFLAPRLDQLHDPGRMLGMGQAVERLRRAIAKNERILIYGDYDVDGTTSVVVLRTAIRLAGGEADYHVPHRVREGYGMRREVIEQAAAGGVRLLISVDNGIREVEAVARARELGIDTIITDHHLPDTAAPPALAILNPNQPGCGYPDKDLCGAGVAFKLSQALLATLDWPGAKRDRVLASLLKIVAIATVADVVPLRGENRVFVKLGLDGLRDPRQPGLRALLRVARVSAAPSAGDLGFRVGPRLNAAGRMDEARDVVELLSTGDAAEAERLASKLDRLNSERQRTEDGILTQVLEQLGEVPEPSKLPVMVVAGEEWHVGVIGIVASRLVERFHRPALVLSCDQQGVATGSGRSIPKFHFLESLESAADLLERFGGHRQAAGCTIAAERIPELRRRLCAFASARLEAGDYIPVLKVDAELGLDEVGDRLMEQIASLAPHGLGNPKPRFSAAGTKLAVAPRVLKEKHLKLRLSQGTAVFTAMGWRMAERRESLNMGTLVDAVFTIEADRYAGGWQLILEDFRPASAVPIPKTVAITA